MDLRGLEAMIAVERTGNFTKAANKLNLSQPALSRRVSGLEQEVGLALIERRRGRAGLTEAGKALLPHAEAAVASVQDGWDAIQAIGSGQGGTLVLAVPDMMCRPPLLAALQDFRRDFPHVELSLRTGNSTAVSDLVRRGEATIGMRFRLVHHPRLSAAAIATETMVVICAAGHPLRRHGAVEPERLAGETWIGIPTASDEPDGGLRNTLSEYGLQANRVMPISDFVAQKSLIEAGFGIGLCTRESVLPDLESGRLATLEVTAMRSDVPVVLLTRKDGYLGRPARSLIERVKQTMAGDPRLMHSVHRPM